jgi:dihydroorotase
MSKLMHFGVTLDDVVTRVTAIPAKIAGLDGGVGTLRPGANADVAILELRDGSFEFRDTDGNTVNGKRRLITQLTLKDGRVIYERPAE